MNADVLVIGGGLHGLSAALQSARRGVSVILVEKFFLGRHASGATAAGVRTLGRDAAELPLSLEAAEDWHHMKELVGDDCGFTAGGQLQVAEDEAALTATKERIGRLEARGSTHERLIGQNELRALVPDIAPHCLGAAWVATDGSADPHRTVLAFRDAALKAGVRMFEECAVTKLRRSSGQWHAETAIGAIEAGTVVNTAGAWAHQIAALAGEPINLGVRPSMMVVTERIAAAIAPVVSSRGRKLSFKQTAQGTLLIGGGSQGKVAADRQTAFVDVVALAESVKSAVRLFPAIRDVRIVRSWAGMEAATPDRLPVVGFSRKAEGLIHAFGFSGHGFQLVPSVGRVVADLVCEGQTKHDLGAFDISRIAANELQRAS